MTPHRDGHISAAERKTENEAPQKPTPHRVARAAQTLARNPAQESPCESDTPTEPYGVDPEPVLDAIAKNESAAAALTSNLYDHTASENLVDFEFSAAITIRPTSEKSWDDEEEGVDHTTTIKGEWTIDLRLQLGRTMVPVGTLMVNMESLHGNLGTDPVGHPVTTLEAVDSLTKSLQMNQNPCVYTGKFYKTAEKDSITSLSAEDHNDDPREAETAKVELKHPEPQAAVQNFLQDVPLQTQRPPNQTSQNCQAHELPQRESTQQTSPVKKRYPGSTMTIMAETGGIGSEVSMHEASDLSAPSPQGLTTQNELKSAATSNIGYNKPASEELKRQDCNELIGDAPAQPPSKRRRRASVISTPSSINSTIELRPRNTFTPEKKRVFFSSNSNVASKPRLLKRFETYGGIIAKSLEDATILCVSKDNPLVKTPKFLTALATGKDIISDEWLVEIGKTRAMLDPSGFIPKDEAKEKQWNFKLEAAVAKGKEGLGHTIKGSVWFTTSFKKEMGGAYAAYSELAKLLGANEINIGIPMVKPPEQSVLVIGSENDADVQQIAQLNMRMWSKDLLPMTILRGKLQTDDLSLAIGIPIKQEEKDDDDDDNDAVETESD